MLRLLLQLLQSLVTRSWQTLLPPRKHRLLSTQQTLRPPPLHAIRLSSDAAAVVSHTGLSFDAAMADPCMLLMMQCMTLHERLVALRVCRRWYRAVKQPAVWEGASLDLSEEKEAEVSPSSRLPWLHSLITRIKIGEGGLLARPTLLAGFSRLHTLQIQRGGTESTPSQQLLNSLRQLRLRELSVCIDPDGTAPLFDAIFGARIVTGSGAPLVHAWRDTLQTLVCRLAASQPQQLAAFLSTLASCNWPALTLLKFEVQTFFKREELVRALTRYPRPPALPSAAIADELQRFMLLDEWKHCGFAIINSECHIDPLGRDPPRIEVERIQVSVLDPLPLADMQLAAFRLPQVASFTSLDYTIEQLPPDAPTVHALFTAIRAEQLPKLADLQLQLRDNSAASEEQFNAIVGVMQGMHSLTDLQLYAAHSEEWSWQTALHHLPSLRKLRLELHDPHSAQPPPLPLGQPTPPPADAILSSVARCSRLELLWLQGPSEPINAVLRALAQEYSSRSKRPPLRKLFLLFFRDSDAQLDIAALRTLADLLPSLTSLQIAGHVDGTQAADAAATSSSASALHGLQPWWRAITALHSLRTLDASFEECELPAILGEEWSAVGCFPHLSHLRLDDASQSSNAVTLLPLLRLPALTHLDLYRLSSDDHQQLHAAIAEVAKAQPNRAPTQLRSPHCLSRMVRLRPDDVICAAIFLLSIESTSFSSASI